MKTPLHRFDHTTIFHMGHVIGSTVYHSIGDAVTNPALA
jgi:hypothetical protein